MVVVLEICEFPEFHKHLLSVALEEYVNPIFCVTVLFVCICACFKAVVDFVISHSPLTNTALSLKNTEKIRQS